MLTTTTVLGLAAAAGLLSHWQLFLRGEWERHTPAVAAVYSLAAAGLLAAFWLLQRLPLLDSLWALAVLAAVYALSLFASISIYRLCFHSLKQFPGPVAAKLSGFWSVACALPQFKFHEAVQTLHAEHGDFVRIRPREISVNNAAAVRDIHGYGSVCLKGPFYDLNYPSRSLQMTRDKAFHSRRRRTWDRGFSPKALSEYEPRVYQHCLDLVKQLSRLAGTPVDIGKWFKYFGFDVMGDLSFGRPFDMLTTGNPHFLFGMMESSKPVVGTLIGVPWLFILFQKLPGISRVRSNWISWCGVQVQERMKLGTTRPDLFSYILGNDLSEATSDGDLTYAGNWAIVGQGSEDPGLSNPNDFSSTFLGTASQRQKKGPSRARRSALPDTHARTQFLAPEARIQPPSSKGCIKRKPYGSSRPSPAEVQRLTPPQGAMIADRWIPGDTIVSTPTYTLHRADISYSQIISSSERWSSKPGLIISARTRSTRSWQAGYSCAGRPLAMMEMRMLLAMVVRLFDFSFPKESRVGAEKLYDGKGGFRDYFTAGAPTVPLVFTKRSLDSVANGT
ncbi:cytochrome P450 monooxygenase [Trichophyton equinum CBS 127.97]|uniref:Cytochrome P450 monooxygenase n=1 Tax=Trichophyton equinum (strain ATCC MYA-4606 / CBS 127.97) TaxID=559882 RepID=F2Q180_TRIEC|nr:cytochrome P450 monooxygenase [Trichophyton equinum CBS 127.97]